MECVFSLCGSGGAHTHKNYGSNSSARTTRPTRTKLHGPTIQSAKQSWWIDAVESGSNHNWVSLVLGLAVLARPSLRQQSLE